MIAKEGWPFVLIGLVLTVLILYGATRWDSKTLFSIALVSGLLTMFTLFFFRDPERAYNSEGIVLVSPADGKVIGVELLPSHPFIEGETVKISIFLSVFDVHINRIPADGVIEYVKYNPGEFFAAFEDKASDKNEQTEFGMTTASGQKIVFKQIAGLIARRIVYYVKPQDTVSAGERFGLIRFGSRTELFVPSTTKVLVKEGDYVRGGSTIIGFLSGPHDS